MLGSVPVVPLVDNGLGNTSWAVALPAGVVVVDPSRDPAPYLAVAERLGHPIVLAAETHLHADFVTGAPELAARGAPVVASAAGSRAWPHRALADGDVLDLDGWTLTALATPGHTPEHLSYLLSERTRPRAVFTGGSLLVGAVARTDLVDPADTKDLARALWRSINHRLLALPDDVAVFPTHGAGSFCSAAGGEQRSSTIGHERRTNPLLQAGGEDEFVRRLLDGLGSYPPYFGRLREVNRLGPRLYGVVPELAELDGGRAAYLRARGAVIVDVRPVADYARAHIPGSLANALRPQFASWIGWLVADPATPLIFVTDGDTDQHELVRQCLNIGYENLAGKTDVDTWRAGGGETVATPVLTAAHLDGRLDGRRVVDVRQTGEFAAGHLPGAFHVEL
ncbi:MAG: rhodanese-like domain-containing protein, partial [Acidimicrobiales bacterium]